MAGGGRRHVGEDHIGTASLEVRAERSSRSLPAHIQRQHLDAGKRLDGGEIDGEHLPLSLDRAHTLRRDLAPASGGSAQIHHNDARLQEVVLVVYLDELERRARSVAPALPLLDVRIVELSGEPAGRGNLSPLGRAHLDGELAAAAAAVSAPAFGRAYELLIRRIGAPPWPYGVPSPMS